MTEPELPAEVSQQLNAEVVSKLSKLVLPDSAALPAAFYHYTTLDGLLGIVHTRSIWATDVRYLNDEREFQYALDLLTQAVNEVDQVPGVDSSVLQQWLGALEITANIRLYVSSFSEHGDLLSQWRAYGSSGSGVSLGFDSYALSAVPSPGVFLTLKCIYDTTLQRQLIEQGVALLGTEYSTATARYGDGLDIQALFATYFALFAFVLAASFKHPSFAEEAEWRITITSQSPDAEPPTFRPGHGTLLPYASLRLQAPASPIKLTRIVVGPTAHRQLSVESVKSLVDRPEVDCGAVVPSDVPFRRW